jgi:RNA polymerase sigma-70 factor (ECF subfamily)
MRTQVLQALKLLHGRQPRALDRALELLQGTVTSFGMKVCGHREDAEDTAQEVLLKAIPYLARFDSPQALAVWLYKVAKNQCLMSRRRSRFAPQPELSLDELMPEGDELERLARARQDTPESALVRAEDAEHLHEAVLCLPLEYRVILVLHDMEELSTAEVAKITGLREGTVRVRLHRARLFLRKELAGPSRSSGRVKLKSWARRPTEHARGQRPGRCRQLFAKLSDYLDGALDDSLCQELEKHLDGCAPCEAFLSSLEQTIEQCRKFQTPCQPTEEAARVRQRLLEQCYEAIKASRTSSTEPAIDARLAEGLADIDAGRTFGPFASADEMIAHIEARATKRATTPRPKPSR